MTRVINFKAADASKSDVSAANGEVAAVYGLTQRRDGSWANLPEPPVEAEETKDGMLPVEVEAPIVQFGLQRAGMLVTADRVVTQAGTLPSTNGNGAAQTRPVVTAHHDESANVSKAIVDSYTAAVRHQATANGYVTQPFMLRYGLRMYGGRYMWMSQPVMMLPTVLPPRIGVTTTTDSEGVATIAIDLTQNKYFRLRYRVVEGIAPALRELVEAIDIFVSQPVDTYDTTGADHGYITTYSQVVEAAGSLGSLRGRQPSRAEDGTFEGHYSESGDCYIDHLLPEMSHHVWFVAPNPRMTDQLLTADRYYRVASLPASKLQAMSKFATLPLATADFRSLGMHAQISVSDLPNVYGLASVATAIEAVGDTLIVAADSRMMAKPSALAASAPYYGDASAATPSVNIEVYLRHNGQVHRVAATGPGMAESLADYIPRYISYPDAEAFMMVLRQGDIQRVLPLTADEQGASAYWCYMTAEEATEPDIPANASGPEIQSAGSLYVGDHYRLRLSAVRIGATVHALCAAMHAARSGQFGQYPVYAFTTKGVFMLRLDDSSHTITAARQISAESCTSSKVAPDGEGRVYYAADGRIRVVDGSECRTLTDTLAAWSADVSAMPHAAEIVERHGIGMIEEIAQDVFAEPSLSYDRSSRMLWVQGVGIRLAYAADTGVWSVDTTGTGLMITRAMKVEPAGEPLRTVEVIGRVLPRHVMIAVYGSNDLIHWHMSAAVEGLAVSLCDATPYRYWRLLMLTELGNDEWIHGLLG